MDTNIPCQTLWEISDYHRVAVMLSPQSMSVEKFFDRSDGEKQLLKSEIQKCSDPEGTLQNFMDCIARVNSIKYYRQWESSGFSP